MITILFGEMGSGKNYVGSRLASQLGQPFVDGDSFLPQDLNKKLEEGGFLNVEDVERFFRDYFMPGIQAANESFPDGFVLAQALYSESHRKKLAMNFNCEFLWVKTPFWRHLMNLGQRPNRWRWFLHMLISKPFFKFPYLKHQVIVNNGNAEKLTRQLEAARVGL